MVNRKSRWIPWREVGEFYWAFPLAFNYYNSKRGYKYWTIVIFFLAFRLITYQHPDNSESTTTLKKGG